MARAPGRHRRRGPEPPRSRRLAYRVGAGKFNDGSRAERAGPLRPRSAFALPFLLLPLQHPGGGPALVRRRVLDDAVGLATLVALGQVLRDGGPVRADEEQTVAVLVL